MWIFDKLFNRKIEGKSSLDHLESLTPLEEDVEKISALAGKSTELLAIEDKVSVGENGVEVDNLIVSGHISGDVVHTMPAPSSNTLTDEEFSKVIGGVFVIGTFLGLQNPILCTPTVFSGVYVGIIISGTTISAYTLIESSKVIAKRTIGTSSYNLDNLNQINGKGVPSYPADSGSFTLKCVDGALTWVQDE